ncbi:hypothetical protein [Nonomuraea sp. NPDC049709]|uniref:hypothetical protein n=1 Tax=Nonomuraea sp. NPDC049709 TaxID=3154736 RepID=UPI003422E1F9
MLEHHHGPEAGRAGRQYDKAAGAALRHTGLMPDRALQRDRVRRVRRDAIGEPAQPDPEDGAG